MSDFESDTHVQVDFRRDAEEEKEDRSLEGKLQESLRLYTVRSKYRCTYTAHTHPHTLTLAKLSSEG